MLASIAPRYLFREAVHGLKRSVKTLGVLSMKMASRFLLPLEVFSALMMLTWGIAGGYVGGRFWNILAQRDLNTQWGLWLCGVALVQISAACVEGAFGRRWPEQVLLRSVQIRFWAAFAGSVAWIYVGYVLLTVPEAGEVCVLVMQAPIGLLTCWLIALQNRKVEVLLDPRFPTRELQRREERNRGIGDTH